MPETRDDRVKQPAPEAGPAEVEATRESPVFTPPADIVETEGEFLVTLDLPGADPESVDVLFENDVLRVRARQQERAQEGFRLVLAEFEYGELERSFRVTDQVQADAIEAKYRNGVLELRLPKVKPERRKVTVHAS